MPEWSRGSPAKGGSKDNVCPIHTTASKLRISMELLRALLLAVTGIGTTTCFHMAIKVWMIDPDVYRFYRSKARRGLLTEKDLDRVLGV